MRAIFISYRREDSEGHAGRLFEDLKSRFGARSVFMDVAGIEPGRDFRRVIEEQVASCGVLLAIIGKDWLDVVDAQGRRRLDDPADFVRLETASALRRDIPVIPVLVHDATMPRAEQLPDDLKDLAYRNSVELTHARWASDVQLLIAALLPYVDSAAPAAPPTPAPRRRWWWALTIAAVAAGGVVLVQWQRRAPPPPSIALAAGASAAAPTASAPAPAAASASEPPRVLAAAPPPASASATPSVSARPVDKPAPIKRPPPAPPPAASLPRAAAVPVPVAAPPPATAVAPAAAPPAAVPVASSPPAATVLATASDPGLDWFGSAAPATLATRTIAIRPDTRYVNVTGGEIIRFDVGERSFVWNFNGRPSSFDLRRVAPPTLLDRKVTVYVAPDPMYPRRK